MTRADQSRAHQSGEVLETDMGMVTPFGLLPLIQEADLDGKVVLVRFDHNVVKDGEIRDPYRIDRSLGTLYNIVERGGRPILMTHIGRPRDRKTGAIHCEADTSADAVAAYLEQKLHSRFFVPSFTCREGAGIAGIDTSINLAIRELRERRIGGIYLPNIRWFHGEEAGGAEGAAFARQLAGLADVYINDAFGSWQPHVSTFDIASQLPAFAGYLMQEETRSLARVLEPDRPFVAVVAGAKYDTKIGPLHEIFRKADSLILGGVIYNAFLAARYGLKIMGVSEEDMAAAGELVRMNEEEKKIVELPWLVESDLPDRRKEGRFRRVSLAQLREKGRAGYLLDIDPRSFGEEEVAAAIGGAKTIFVNAVMGFTPHFSEGSAALDETIDRNREAMKLYGGGDTLQEFKNLCPGLYLSVMDSANYYFFTGGGTVLTAIEAGSPSGLQPVRALIESGGTGAGSDAGKEG
jgi:phosphoglycerate kinase